MKQAQFLPAISTATTGYLHKYTDEQFIAHSENITKSFRFFNTGNDAYFNHPFVLISAAHMFKKTDDLRKEVGIDDKAIIFIDSGGYQLSSGAIKKEDWDNGKAFDWSMKNGNIFPILDRPLYGDAVFDKNLSLSLESAEYYASNRTKKDGKIILNVVQGRNLTEIDTWLDTMSNVPLDGWAHGGHLGHVTNIMTVVLELINKGLMEKSKLHHIFGASSASNMIYFAVIQDELNKMGYDTQLTYDSSYFQRSFAFGNFFLYKKFDGMVNVRLSNRYDWSQIPKGTKVPCDCSLCSNVKDIHSFFDDSMVFYMIGAMHNLYQMLSYKKSVENILHLGNVQPKAEHKDIEPFLRTALPVKMWNNICAIREAFANPKSGRSIILNKFIDRDLGDAPNTLDAFFGEK